MKPWILVIIVAWLLSVTIQAQTELSVSAAASLKNAFTDIVAGFEKDHPGVKVLLNFAGSGQLQAQIEAGAPVDVFASAST
ncbi:MAG TPA: molybdate ABC transporter substrate-binding protein, partial [Longilinea sp.]|nr:molybdate ABC transporter substrate-binding protein [Longilinea sp.]